jgi:hypothetical protein
MELHDEGSYNLVKRQFNILIIKNKMDRILEVIFNKFNAV